MEEKGETGARPGQAKHFLLKYSIHGRSRGRFLCFAFCVLTAAAGETDLGRLCRTGATALAIAVKPYRPARAIGIALPPAGRRSHRKTTPRRSVTSLGSELSLEAADAAARPGEANWPVAVPRAAYAGTRARPAPVIVASSFL